ncbi:MAG: hypothetical protein K0R54_702 [Clostridiaceae bacterium]|jgi:hypothetical protein|nr:hypothetical protein [Clostridiaceae bacterium]
MLENRKVLGEVLLNVGSIVEVEHKDATLMYLIVSRRIINWGTMRAWDYYSVPYPEGGKKDKEGYDDNGFYFNHYEIEKIIYSCNVSSEKVEL